MEIFLVLKEETSSNLSLATLFVAIATVVATLIGHFISLKKTRKEIAASKDLLLSELKEKNRLEKKREVLRTFSQLLTLLNQVKVNGAECEERILNEIDSLLFELELIFIDKPILQAFNMLREEYRYGKTFPQKVSQEELVVMLQNHLEKNYDDLP